MPVPAAALAGVCVLAAAFGDPGRLALRFDRGGLESWQLWRLLTAHVVHLSWSHTLMNVAALLLTAEILRREIAVADWVVAAPVAALGVSAGLYFFSTIEWYVGLSGVLHGVLVCGSFRLIERRGVLGWLLLVAVIGKLAFEQAVGPLPYTAAAADGPVVVDAHLYGAVAGAISYPLRGLARRFVRASDPSHVS